MFVASLQVSRINSHALPIYRTLMHGSFPRAILNSCLAASEECARGATVCRAFSEALHDESLWRRHLADDFAQEGPSGPSGVLLRSFRLVYDTDREIVFNQDQNDSGHYFS